MSPALFSPLTLRGAALRNRIGVSPMCQYSATDGHANDWHLVHIGARAAGGAGLVIMEATGVAPAGRISPACLGLWDDKHIPMLAHIVDFARRQGAVMGIQLAHAGRKASVAAPWTGGKPLAPDAGGWETLAPSPLPFSAAHATPREMTAEDIDALRRDFVSAAKRAVAAGFQVIELHGAHGYLLHQFLSPLTNHRADAYGRDKRLLLNEIAQDVRKAVPDHIALGARLSCTDWTDGGITPEDSVETARQLQKHGVDFIDCSSGGLVPDAKIPLSPGYQVPFSRQVREGAKIPTAAVGLITQSRQAEEIVAKGEADIVLLAREMLRDPHFPLRAAKELGVEIPAPPQYARAF